MFNKINASLVKAAEYMIVLMMVVLAVALFTGVLARYVFSVSIPEIEVIRKFAITWLVFMGSAVAVKDKQHLEIDVFTEYLSEKKVHIKNILVYVLTMAGIIILVFVGYAAFQAGLNRTELVVIRFLSSPPSLTYYYSGLFIGAIMMLYFHLTNIKQTFKQTKLGEKK